ncbi:Thyroid adenoma-associated protein-like protein [Frankliniella fusca]|uniref:tRNA (32-2'-O)-methyltransferase regulator THADA n=1 Tax=Frankliniella fusca TaxID=407009 RepID=A0AAE1I2N1_9NEOP|nr:Thyroid adenoma-associated protein-like protein [Frankliniella fusca]
MNDPLQSEQLKQDPAVAKNMSRTRASETNNSLSGVIATSITVPDQFVQANILHNVTLSCNVEEQMDAVKKISSHLTLADNDISVVLDFNCVSIAADMYLKAPLKHPVKCALSKTFNLLNQHAKEASIKCLQEGLKRLMQEAVENEKDIAFLTIASSALLGCCENFKLGTDVLDTIALDVIVYLEKSLSMCESFLSSSITPMLKVEVCKAAHTISRIIITVFQQITTNPEDDLQILKLKLSLILNSAVQFMNRTDIPLDTRINFGFVLVLILDYLEGPQSWMQLLETKRNVQTVDELSILCICSGLLSGLKSDQFEMLHPSSKKAVISCILDVVLSVNELCIQESNVVLALWRVVQQLTRVLASNSKLVNYLQVAQIESIFKHLMGLLDHYIDAVRHLARAILENLMQVKDTFRVLGVDLGQKMAEAVRFAPETKRSRYVILSTMTAYMSTSEIMEKIPDVISYLLHAMQHTSMSSHVSGAFVAMSSADFKTLPYSQWYKTWVEPLFLVMLENDSIESPALEEALSKIVKMCPSVINEVFSAKDKEQNSELPRLKIMMTCVKLGRKQGVLVINNEEELWFGILPVSLLRCALWHECDKIRIAALGLIIETNRSTELFSQVDLTLLKSFLECNVNCEIPSFRQEALALMSKLFTRMKDSINLLKRHTKTKKKIDIDFSKILSQYKEFILWILPFCFCNLRVGSNYSRRIFILKLLIIVTDILKSDTLLFNDDCLQAMWTDENAFTLLSVILTDTYEDNKAMATKLLGSYPDSFLLFHIKTKRLQLFKKGCNLASSIRPADCISAAYLLELCCLHTLKTDDSSNHLSEAVFKAVTALKTQLESELNVAHHNILQAASKGPMYGTLFCIRHLLQLITDFSELKGEPRWQLLIKDLVSLCFKLDEIATPIVNSSSPEGHLPMDFNDSTSSSILQSKMISSPDRHPKVTAQMVLLCSWRTVKEVSLLLGKLSDCCPILPDPCGLLSEDEILAIGVHLTTLLEETKHRGAFEQAYVGFSLLAARLWRHPKPNLQELPQIWLSELLDAVQSNERTSSKFCATRRSAGVPYLVQALVSAELQTVGSPQSLQTTISQLLVCAADNDRHVECRTHALNILRALFRHAPLAEHVAPYISEGVVVAVSGFKCKSWAERNSATLLFSSLMTRIFGVRRSREELSSRNKMTGRVFFHRYPELYDFLLSELSQAVNAVNSGDVGQLAILHPILLLIGRLYPTSLEGMDTPMQLSSFVPLVRKCASNSVLKTRVLAAKAVVPLITTNLFVDYVDDLIKQMSFTHSGNLSHGIALQVFHLLANSAVLNSEQSLKIANQLNSWLSAILVCMSKSTCNPLRELILQIIELAVVNWFSSTSSAVWNSVKELLSVNVLALSGEKMNGSALGLSVLEMRATRVLLQLLIYIKDADLKLVVLKLLQHNNDEVLQETLVFLERLMRDHSPAIIEDFEDVVPDVFGGDKHWTVRLSQKAHSECNLAFRESKELGQRLLAIAKSKRYIQGRLALQVLAQVNPSLWCPDVDLRHLLLWCTSPNEGTSCAALSCFSSVLSYMVQCHDIVPEICECGCKLVISYCGEKKSTFSRKTAARFLVLHRKALDRQYSFLTDETVCELWITGVKLTCDDDASVRLEAALLSQAEIPSVPQKCLENLLENFSLVMRSSPANCLATLIVLALGPLPDSSYFEADEEKVFEKGDSNMFIEHEILTDLTLKHISYYVCNGVSLSPKQWNWVWTMIGGVDQEGISSAQYLFDAVRDHNNAGLVIDGSDWILPPAIVCSLRCLKKVEQVFFGAARGFTHEFPFITDKVFVLA